MASKRKDASVESKETSKAKKVKHDQKYRNEYSEVPGIQPSIRGVGYAFCKYCKKDFTISHSGKYDIERHVQSNTHSEFVKVAKSSKQISNFFVGNQASVVDNQVTRAEAIFSHLLVQMNLPLSAADSITKAVKVAFPDSEVAKRYECGRSKTTAIVKELAHDVRINLIDSLKTNPFSVATDGSNDEYDKQFPLVISFAHSTGVKKELLSVPVLRDMSATGENIFNLICNEVEANSIPWSNCLSLASDNAYVMTGRKKGVFAFMLEKQPQLHLSGCPCHLIHLAAEKGAAQLPFNIDEILVDTYYYLDKSSKRLSGLGEWQKLYDIEHGKILKHVSTRWLSIGRSLDRVLENWEALKQYFHAEANVIRENTRKKMEKEKKTKTTLTTQNKNPKANPQPSRKEGTSKTSGPSGPVPALSKAEKLETFYKSPTNKLYCLFLQYAIKPFDQVNIKLQSEAPLVHKLQGILIKFFRDLLVRFITPAGIHSKPVTEVPLEDKKIYKVKDQVLIGEDARSFIAKKKEVHLRESRIEEFYTNARLFYVAACKYIREKFPLTDILLSHAEVADTHLQLQKSLTDLHYFINRYPCLVPDGCSLDTLELEYSLYQSHNLPNDVADERLGEDVKWVKLGQTKDSAGEAMFSNLAKVMVGILTIPHSNAACERVFSVVRKNKTYQRASLGNETLNA